MPIVRMDPRVQPMIRQRRKRPVITFSTNADTAMQKRKARQHGKPFAKDRR